MCIHKDYQRQGYFQIFSHILYDHINKNGSKYYVALIEKKFYRMLRFMLGSGVEQKGKALIGPTTALIPTILNINKIMEDEVKVKRLLQNI
ncbi:hypothetical protein CIL05_02590 [Virgibacillus profundi]|uniref:N-acetyltransferase domain-containing protein n=1 Tax=Virgibacillus profundi TaxID=2024555 RepID=A0A2A2IKD7_9BACI|nr:hypothetical protein [Virgibacillus profundi]PAV31563.1 hypothetical protein CIL05_02590 [Virgibacillus profundi]PXY55749.1 hypothetical protein CIT14_02595 [Virgibacillus profundi]